MNEAPLSLDEHGDVDLDAAPIRARVLAAAVDLVPALLGFAVALYLKSAAPAIATSLWWLLRDYRHLSLGNRVAKIEVLRLDGRAASPVDSLVRNSVHGAASSLRKVAALALGVGLDAGGDQLAKHHPALGLLLAVIALGIVLTDAYLLVETPSRRLLGDFVAGTRVRTLV